MKKPGKARPATMGEGVSPVWLEALLVARVGWAALLLLCPDTLFRVMGGGRADRRWRLVARVLGARHLAEAILEHRGGSERIRLAAVVDALHSASVVGYAALDRPRRRVALVDASVAGSFAAYGRWLAGSPAV